jgi:hypothetical protein
MKIEKMVVLNTVKQHLVKLSKVMERERTTKEMK